MVEKDSLTIIPDSVCASVDKPRAKGTRGGGREIMCVTGEKVPLCT
jgi:hypothetical protein